MAITDQEFCDEFATILNKYAATHGGTTALANWFGRLLAYEYELDLNGQTITEEDLKARLSTETLTINLTTGTTNITDSDVSDDPDGLFTVTGTVKGDGGTYEFEHELQWTLRATRTTLTKVS